ncbi:hypothetical protein L1987_51080 [Smallanthus sonchifolius]|uniref:Uncharacterized protein n=1 Tax=Smallanthus sonchifolius TaxID=185202 RepID=A0ACB9EPC2_9ASTR|nr:hypothetical protein L1987_51080 [Smallanthus sonchifolius]
MQERGNRDAPATTPSTLKQILKPMLLTNRKDDTGFHQNCISRLWLPHPLHRTADGYNRSVSPVDHPPLFLISPLSGLRFLLLLLHQLEIPIG